MKFKSTDIAQKMYELIVDLFPICRSLTGNGVRESLTLVQGLIPSLQLFEEPSGKKVYDWIIPDEWNINDAYIVTPDGDKIAEFSQSNLHVLNYSAPVDQELPLEELQKHLYSLPDRPDDIPYVTSYYERRWGFCLTENVRRKLKPGKYRVVVDSTLEPGSLTYGEVTIEGKRKDKEIFLSTYICHPSLANNELSGPAVLTYIAKWLIENQEYLNYSYRIVFVPETIGSITYIHNNIKELRRNVICGFNVTCVGDNNNYSYLSSRTGDTLADRVVKHVMFCTDPDYKSYSYLDRGSDERQYGAPGVDLPLCSIMRTKYAEYPEYHTSADNLEFVSPEGLGGSYDVIRKCIEVLENNVIPESNVICEPQLGKRGLYSTLGGQSENNKGKLITDLLAYSDGRNDLLQISEILGQPFWDLQPIVNEALEHNLITLKNCNV